MYIGELIPKLNADGDVDVEVIFSTCTKRWTNKDERDWLERGKALAVLGSSAGDYRRRNKSRSWQ